MFGEGQVTQHLWASESSSVKCGDVHLTQSHCWRMESTYRSSRHRGVIVSYHSVIIFSFSPCFGNMTLRQRTKHHRSCCLGTSNLLFPTAAGQQAHSSRLWGWRRRLITAPSVKREKLSFCSAFNLLPHLEQVSCFLPLVLISSPAKWA